jgi:hypothetical protein
MLHAGENSKRSAELLISPSSRGVKKILHLFVYHTNQALDISATSFLQIAQSLMTGMQLISIFGYQRRLIIKFNVTL